MSLFFIIIAGYTIYYGWADIRDAWRRRKP
jgi:hypothetical protein